MRPEDSGREFRSRPYPVTLGSTQPIELPFLQPALSFASPQITEIGVRIFGSVKGAGAGAGALGRDAAKLIDKIEVMDAQPIVNASGAGLRWQTNQLEWGDKAPDPGDVATGVTNAAYDYTISLPFEFDKSSDDADSYLSLVGFLHAGGQINVTFAAALPTDWDALTSLQCEVYVIVKEARRRLVGARLVVYEYNAQLAEDNIACKGLLRSFGLTSKLGTTGYTSLATQTTVNSMSLGFQSNYATARLRTRYRKTFPGSPSPVDEALLATPGALPIFFPDSGQKFSQLPKFDRVHIKLESGATPASGRWIVASYQERSPVYAAAAMGCNSPEEYVALMRDRGVVRCLTEDIPVTKFDPRLVGFYPLALRE